MKRTRLLIGLAGPLLVSMPSFAEDEKTVIVRGTRAPVVSEEPEVSVGVIEGEPLCEPGSDTADVLARSPGVQVSRAGTSADLVTVSIRGAEASQVPVYVAGIRLNDDVVGVTDLSRVPLWMMHRAEVYRGAAPLSPMRSGLGGAIVFEPTLPRSGGYRIGALAGSFGAGALWLGGTAKHSKRPNQPWVTSVAVRRSGATNDFEFESDGGTAFLGVDDEVQVRANADYLENDLWVISRGRARLGSRTASLVALYNHFHREQGVSGLSLLPALRARARVSRDLMGLTSRLSCGWGQSCSLVLSSSAHVSRLLTIDPMGELSLGAAEVDQRGQRGSQLARLSVALDERWQIALGTLLELSRIQLDAPETVLARATENYLGGQVELKFSPARDRFVRGMIRAICLDARGVNAGEGPAVGGLSDWSQCQPEARVGAYKEIGDAFSLRAVAETAVRFPTLGERFGVSATTRGNVDLDVERGFSVDLGARYQPALAPWGSYWLDLAAFERVANDLVAFQRSALGYVRPFNVGTARFFGGEIAGEIDAWGHLRTRSSVSLLDPRDVSEGRTTENTLIPFRSQITATEELEIYTKARFHSVSHLGLIGYLTYRSGRVADPAGLIVIPQQAVVDLALRAQFLRRIDARARVENLLASNRYDTIGFPLPGRSYFMSLELIGE